MEQDTIINEGGINGTGEALVNTNSEEFRALQAHIRAHASAQSEAVKIENGLLSVRFQMESYLHASLAAEDIKPAGYFVEKLLDILPVTKKQLAAYIGYEYSNFIAVIKGRRRMNSELALQLGQIFRIDPALWLHVESKNELASLRTQFDGRFTLADLLGRYDVGTVEFI